MAKRANTILPRYATGSLAAALSLYFVYEGRADLSILAASIFFLLICVVDTVCSRIPNIVNLLFLLTGFGFQFYAAGASGLLFATLGMLTGLSLMLLPYLMGGMGAGDVKAMAALGALLGPVAIFQVFLYTGLIGGLLALFHYALSHNLKEKCLEWSQAIKAFVYTKSLQSLKPSGTKEPLRFPYAAAIAFGFFAYINWGGLL
jgi:prepilin peptidase CpaA